MKRDGTIKGVSIKILFVLSLVNLFFICNSCSAGDKKVTDDPNKIEKDRKKILSELKDVLKNEFDLWYPLCMRGFVTR